MHPHDSQQLPFELVALEAALKEVVNAAGMQVRCGGDWFVVMGVIVVCRATGWLSWPMQRGCRSTAPRDMPLCSVGGPWTLSRHAKHNRSSPVGPVVAASALPLSLCR